MSMGMGTGMCLGKHSGMSAGVSTGISSGMGMGMGMGVVFLYISCTPARISFRIPFHLLWFPVVFFWKCKALLKISLRSPSTGTWGWA